MRETVSQSEVMVFQRGAGGFSMRTKQALAIALSLLLVALPLWSSPDILGTVTNSQETFVRGANAAPGGSIFNGDTITVSNSGSAWLSLAGGGQAMIGHDSRVRLTRDDNAVALEVSSGEVTFRSAPNAPLVGLVADGTFRSVSSGLAVGQITFLEGNRALFSVRQGVWTLATENSGASVTLHPGESMEARVVPESALPAAPPQSNPPPSNKNDKKKKWGLILLGAGLIGGATGIGLGFGSGESGVTFQQKLNAISPVVP
jgi:hypothetical protein